MAPLLPTLAEGARTLLSRAIASTLPFHDKLERTAIEPSVTDLGPLEARSVLLARDASTPTVDPSVGSIDPHNINNTALFVLFGLIGVAFVVAGVWFFFWAKNGGFYFKENDWDDYKTTVLRRRGPNGTILSNATKSTNLGGGSIYKDIDDGSTEYTGGLTTSHLSSSDTASTMTGITAGASDIVAREKRKAKREKRDREREKKKDRKARGGRKVGEDGMLVDETAEADAQDAMRQYRHERPARVGGLNKESEGSTWDGSTNPSESTTAESDLLSNRQSTPTKETKKGGAIRKVYSVADRNAAREQERIRAEARRLQEKGRAATASRRDFSFRRGDSIVEETVGRSEVDSGTGSYVTDSWTKSDVSSDLGTKSYRHHIPGLSASAAASQPAGGSSDIVDYAEERRKKRGAGYRRPRGE
ncbi:hypothetical protein BX600DRAFT_441363 [Xylariales sp. PMI_506]|nr:hypothetical protein BX600DRAFT_441363 [Xylariales sp. PMI_506]